MDDRQVVVMAVRHRLAALADAILAAELAQAELAVTLEAAKDQGLSDEDVAVQVRRVSRERPERGRALDRLAVLDA